MPGLKYKGMSFANPEIIVPVKALAVALTSYTSHNIDSVTLESEDSFLVNLVIISDL